MENVDISYREAMSLKRIPEEDVNPFKFYYKNPDGSKGKLLYASCFSNIFWEFEGCLNALRNLAE